MTQIARQRGEDPNSLRQEFQGQIDATILTSKFEETYRDAYVRAGVSNEDEAGDAWVIFTEEPSPVVKAQLAALSIDTNLMWGAPANAVELSDLAGRLVGSLDGRQVYVHVGSNKSRYANSMTITYSPREKKLDDDQQRAYEAEALQAGAQASRDGKLPVPVDFFALPPDTGAPILQTTIQGGRPLHRDSDSTFYCTGGFTASRNGQKGLLTAGHCNEPLRWSTLTGRISRLGLQADVTPSGRGIDLQWHPTLSGHSTDNQFRAFSRSRDDDVKVTARANPKLDDDICKWGEQTGFNCAQVRWLDECRSDGSLNGACGLDLVTVRMTEFGDSGGPWFIGSVANGIHHGVHYSSSGGLVSVYTRIGRVRDSLDATILGS